MNLPGRYLDYNSKNLVVFLRGCKWEILFMISLVFLKELSNERKL